MLLRHQGGASPHVVHAAAPRIQQLLPDDPSNNATLRTVAIANSLKSSGGEMVVAGGNQRAEALLRRAGVDHRPYTGSRAALFQMSATQALLDTVHQRDLDLVHVHGCDAALAAKAFAEAANLPLVMTCEQLPKTSGFMGRRSARKYLAGRPVIVRSDYAAECLRRDFALPDAAIRVIPPGVDAAAFNAASVSPERTVALVERWSLVEDSRPVILVPDAPADTAWLNWVLAAACDPNGPDATWLLVGDETLANGANTRITQTGARARVRWISGCEDWAAAYKLASLVVSLPNAAPALCDHALHAQAMGRPVITTDSGAAGEVIQPGKTGWLIRHRDSGSLAYAVSAALEREEIIRNAMSMAARNLILTQFSVQRMQAATLAVYAEVLDQNNGG